MDRHCINGTAADQYAQRQGYQDDLELTIERLEIELFEELEQCISQSNNRQLMLFLEMFSDQISDLIRLMLTEQIRSHHEP